MSISDIFSNTTRQGVLKDLICNRAFVRLLWYYCFCNASSSVHFCRSNRHKCMEQKPNIHCYASSLIEAIGASVRNRSNRIERLTFPTVEAIDTNARNRGLSIARRTRMSRKHSAQVHGTEDRQGTRPLNKKEALITSA